MRVIDSEHRRDYYDAVGAQDTDRSIIYNRTPRQYIVGASPESDSTYRGKICKGRPNVDIPNLGSYETRIMSSKKGYRWAHGIWFEPYLIGFCGKIYKESNFGDSLEQADAYMALPSNEEYQRDWPHHRTRVDRFFRETLDPQYDALFAQFNAPIWVLEGDRIYYDSRGMNWTVDVNPILDKYNFVKIVDPHTAWMELRSYISGVLVSPAGVEPLPVSDDIKRDLAGHGPESFKKAPSKEEKHRKRAKNVG